MSSIFCSNGHENPIDSSFCRFCGDSLTASTSDSQDPAQPPSEAHSVPSGAAQTPLVGFRYRILRQLGYGGFGRTYLSEDTQRFDENCVLKEFAPQVEGIDAIRKAESLFEREAGVLYRLKHPQIPKFRELLRAEFEGRDRLFLVQDYVEGSTYQEILDERLLQGKTFAEPEIMQFLSELLPVLDYIHRVGVIHRDIAPDNLILREDDQLPVLIDFGGVKQAAVTVVSELGRARRPEPKVTLVGKPGFAPYEQLQEGLVEPHCDLYALAVTVLVLLTGQPPRDLLNTESISHWEQQVRVSPTLKTVLRRMLSDRPRDRYPSVRDVLHALGMLRLSPAEASASTANAGVAPAAPIPQQPIPRPASPTSTMRTVAVAPGAPRPGGYGSTPTEAIATPNAAGVRPPISTPPPSASLPSSGESSASNPLQGIFAFCLIVALAGVGAWVGYRWIPEWLNLSDTENVAGELDPPPGGSDLDTSSSQFSSDEEKRKNDLRSRRDALSIDTGVLVDLTNAVFYAENPSQQGRALTEAPDDAQWRARWDAIASTWLDRLENLLSTDARRQLGNYGQGDRERWKQAVNRLHVSSSALYDLTDAKFFQVFPDLRDQDFIDRPIGQVWHGIAADQVGAMQAGQTLEDIRFAQGATDYKTSGTLAPGTGQVYTLNVSEGQVLDLQLDAPRRAQLSLYVPRPTDEVPHLLKDSQQRSWSGTLPQSGYYEVSIVTSGDRPIDYRLDIEVKSDK
ncbi:MAG: serine/threonine-protein kinase [Elainellaceae cyanobacterium]